MKRKQCQWKFEFASKKNSMAKICQWSKKVNFDFCYYFIETCQNISCSLPIEDFVESFYVFRDAIPDKMLQTWSLS